MTCNSQAGQQPFKKSLFMVRDSSVRLLPSRTFLRFVKRYFRFSSIRSPILQKSNSDISDSEAQGHLFPQNPKRYFRFSSTRSPISQKSKSDISNSDAQGHLFLKKSKRYFGFGCPRSPIPKKSKAIFQVFQYKITHLAKK